MKNAWRAQTMATIVSVFAVAGCSSTQPDSIGTRTGSVGFKASATVGIYNCYEQWRDTSNPPDGIPDQFITFLCEPVVEQTPTGPIQLRATRAVPWRYSVEITVIRAGTSNEVLMVSSDGTTVGSSVEPGDEVDDFESLTGYDPDQPDVPDKNVGDIYFINGKQVSAGSPLYLGTIPIDPGVPNILLLPTTFDFSVNTGDTVIVRARKQPIQQAPPYLPPSPDPEIKLTSTLSISGVAVAPRGTPEDSPGTTTIEDSSGTTFSYTVK